MRYAVLAVLVVVFGCGGDNPAGPVNTDACAADKAQTRSELGVPDRIEDAIGGGEQWYYNEYDLVRQFVVDQDRYGVDRCYVTNFPLPGVS